MNGTEFLLDHATTKIQDHHRERLAVVYVRQSSPRQVLEHRESAALQYGLAARAEHYGWRKDRILVIDEDQGRTGSTADGREGFQRLLAEVGLNHVGLVLGIEMSRLARSCKDWYQLLELCAVFRSLLADQDGLYDPTTYNDRLLLGLKGTMSEAELHILRGRMQQGSRNKAERGDLITHVPRGYVRLKTDEVVMDPDEQVRSVVRLVFDKFRELGSARSVLRYLLRSQIQLPVRPLFGIQKGQLEWHAPDYPAIVSMIHNPTYAGAYAHGRHQIDLRRAIAGKRDSGRFRAQIDDWKVLIQDRFPAYITWEVYLENVKRLHENGSRFDTPGVPREGPALLSGIMFCGRCQKRMFPAYKGKAKPAFYVCSGLLRRTGEAKCQHIAAKVVDDLVADGVLRAIEPASLELSLTATNAIREERNRLHTHWKQRLERAAYQAQRAKRQFDAVEPENRLVARELERQWEQSLVEQRQLEEQYHRFQQEQPTELSQDDLELIRGLATNLPPLWSAGTMSHSDRQTIVRHLVDRVELTVQGTSELADVQVYWKGGFVTQHQVIRSVAKYTQLHDFQRLQQRVDQLWQAGNSTTAIARVLNSEGFCTPTQGKRYTRHSVRKLLDSWSRTTPKRAQVPAAEARFGPDEWWLTDLARTLALDGSTLARWCRRGWVHARKLSGQRGWWVVWADADERQRLTRLYEHGCGLGRHKGSPPELTTPKRRPKKSAP